MGETFKSSKEFLNKAAEKINIEARKIQKENGYITVDEWKELLNKELGVPFTYWPNAEDGKVLVIFSEE